MCIVQLLYNILRVSGLWLGINPAQTSAVNKIWNVVYKLENIGSRIDMQTHAGYGRW